MFELVVFYITSYVSIHFVSRYIFDYNSNNDILSIPTSMTKMASLAHHQVAVIGVFQSYYALLD
jgi:hypothetical protein